MKELSLHAYMLLVVGFCAGLQFNELHELFDGSDRDLSEILSWVCLVIIGGLSIGRIICLSSGRRNVEVSGKEGKYSDH